MLIQWEKLPPALRTGAVRPYYEALCRRRAQLAVKRGMDAALAAVLLAGLSPVLAAVGAAIKLSEPDAPVLFRQERVTQYGRRFRICKFRTMTPGATGAGVTARGDVRVTPLGKALRRCKLDELPQLWNVLTGDMTFVGTRPEVPRFVERYTPAMRATLLLPAGITSAASLRYRDEERLLRPGCAEEDYRTRLLPRKMRENLDYLRRFSLAEDCRILARTAELALPAPRTGAPGGKPRRR